MSNETRVLNYYNEWAGKGVNPDNGTSVHQTTYGMYLQRAPNQWIVRWHDKDDPEGRRWDIMAFILGLTHPPLTTNEDKSDLFWKQYAQQMRKELTDTQRELADLKSAYSGLCEAHAEAAEKLAEIQEAPISPAAIGMQTEAFLAEQDYNGWVGDDSIKSIVRSAVKNIILRYSIAMKKHGKVPE